MTRDAEHTPSPQSVVVPVERLQFAIDAIAHLKPHKARTVLEQALAAAPAPSSLAGGEVLNFALGRMEYMASACEEHWTSGPQSQAALGVVVRRDDLRAILAALSPEAPAREGEWFGVTGAADETEALAVALFDARCPGIRMTDEDLHYYRAAAQRAMKAVADELDTPALTPRHEAPAELLSNPQELEAPAEGAGEAVVSDADILRDTVPADLLGREMGCLADVWGVRMDGSASVYPSVRGTQAGAQKLADVLNAQSSEGPRYEIIALRARSSAPEAREGEAVGVVYSLKADLNTAELPDGTLLYTHPAYPSADHAELTRLAEAAGEEALGNLLAVIHGDGGHRALEVGTKQAALEAEKIVAGLFAAPSADKLRDVLVDLTSWFTKPVQGQSGMVWVIPAGERGADDALNAALAALKAEV